VNERKRDSFRGGPGKDSGIAKEIVLFLGWKELEGTTDLRGNRRAL